MTKSDPNYYVAGIQKSLKVANENGITAVCRFHGFGKKHHGVHRVYGRSDR